MLFAPDSDISTDSICQCAPVYLAGTLATSSGSHPSRIGMSGELLPPRPPTVARNTADDLVTVGELLSPGFKKLRSLSMSWSSILGVGDHDALEHGRGGTLFDNLCHVTCNLVVGGRHGESQGTSWLPHGVADRAPRNIVLQRSPSSCTAHQPLTHNRNLRGDNSRSLDVAHGRFGTIRPGERSNRSGRMSIIRPKRRIMLAIFSRMAWESVRGPEKTVSQFFYCPERAHNSSLRSVCDVTYEAQASGISSSREVIPADFGAVASTVHATTDMDE
ncbi:hypothetical protein EVG20_g1581 [Dentipellis fragilis]|uniref:Uncharacterized protein n=1 Tax=Dentipellis fragilis TaxID=205917 RepID=A0A4Y9ZDE8_9AGAM|nr:hypothetical protein EVG20_g1581 [Dentipellis fragilis]